MIRCAPRAIRLFCIFICFILFLVPAIAFPGESFDEAFLRLYFTPEHEPGDIVSSGQIERLCMKLGEKAFPILKTVIHRRDRWRWESAVDCLLYIDSPEVIDILRKEYVENPPLDTKANAFLKSSLCRAMSVTKSTKDVEFLISQIDGPRHYFERGSTRSAAFSLAVFKQEDARDALEKRLVKYGTPEYPMENDDIQLALDRINGRIWNTPQDKNPISHDSVTFAVLRFGIPRTAFARSFYDRQARRIWKRDGNTWTYKEGKIDEEFPSMSFRVFTTSDGKYAICKTWVGNGPQSFLEHIFILRKEDGTWRVIRLMQGAMT